MKVHFTLEEITVIRAGLSKYRNFLEINRRRNLAKKNINWGESVNSMKMQKVIELQRKMEQINKDVLEERVYNNA